MHHPQRTRTRGPRNRKPTGGSPHAPPRPSPVVVPTNTFTRPGTRGTLWFPTRQPSNQHPQSPHLNERPQPPQPAPEDDGRLSRGSSDIRLPSIGSLSGSGFSSATRPPPRIEVPLPVAQVRAQVQPRPKSLGQSVVVGIRVERMTSVLAAWDKRWEAACELPISPEEEDSVEKDSEEQESEEEESDEEDSEEEEDEKERAPALPTTITITITTPAKDKSQVLDENIKEDAKAEELPPSSAGGVALPPSVVEYLYRPRTTREMQLEQLKAKIPWLVGQGTLGGAGWRPLEEYYWDEGGSGKT
ncbi:uncharacterized protein LAJ45_10775 [Morchella importuna]|uniref:Uncharacterized protein n=1 Tax=Morchella conica CCBAS932 TaxID=1392247 RepID=A0A3N4KHP5_9PEZI|nr:uncharacterized protein LAJ45_10775 [Morchella importuna]KAH8145214.1 hypothetical protein LAJ45_10775 [Morchella importuna]RPB07881.1 hypothetical protein P167DRAFT_578840 [Morchella conica CCBAS932]